MKLSHLTLILSLIGILTLTFLAQTPAIQIATIESITQSNFKTTIQLQNNTTELIIFDTPNLNLTKGDQIKFTGKPDTYKNQKQIIISKISKLN